MSDHAAERPLSPPSVVPAPEGPARRRRGVALLTALFGIVIIAVMISGAFFASNQEYRGGRNSLVEQRAFAVAEYGLNAEVSNWDRSRNLPTGMAVGSVDSSRVYVAAGDTARVRITRLTPTSYWVTSEGTANIGSAALESRRQTNAYLRIAYPAINPKGAITTAGDISLTGSAIVDGRNTDPTGWGQCPLIPGTDLPAIIAAPGASVTYKPQNIPSTPAVVYDSAAADSNTYVRYGTESWTSLVSNADIVLPGGIYGSDIAPVGTATTCTPSNTNWGEPFRPGAVVGCWEHYPIIYFSSSVKLNGNGYGQGILLVNGDLEINGRFEFFGLVIVRDDIKRGNGTANIRGSVFAANTNLADPSFIAGNQDVVYSKCAVESALRGSAILTRVKERHWSQVQ